MRQLGRERRQPTKGIRCAIQIRERRRKVWQAGQTIPITSKDGERSRKRRKCRESISGTLQDTERGRKFRKNGETIPFAM
jgi:hypothetical protein